MGNVFRGFGWTFPLYNMVPGAEEPAAFGFQVVGVPIRLTTAVRSEGDYGLTVGSSDISTAVHLWRITTEFWGVPANSSHDHQRCDFGNGGFFETCNDVGVNGGPALGPHPSELPTEDAFLRMPTRCTQAGEGLPFAIKADSWLDPGNFAEATINTHEAPYFPEPPGPEVGTEGCEAIPFEPEVSVKPTSNQADSPTGLEFDLNMPQNGLLDPEAVSESDLRAASVTLPEGMVVNPSSAAGLTGCSPQEIGLLTPEGQKPIHFSREPAACPGSSKVGQVEIKSPLLEEPLSGGVYLAKQNDNPFHSLLVLYIVAEGHGVVVKLPAAVKTGPGGQLSTSVEELPQLPFEHMHLVLKSGPRAPLVNPPTCASQTTTATLTPWSGGEDAHLQSTFQLPQGCVDKPADAPFHPAFEAGTVNPQAGATTPFVLNLSRGDGEQRLASLTTTAPAGVSAYLAGVPYCPDSALEAGRVSALTGAAELATPSCPAASQVGVVDTAAGAGSIPFHAPGKAYLAGPYKGAPFSLAFFVPAVAGPFDLGDVMVRAATHVDPQTAQVTVASDPLPQILEGIPLDVRALHVNLNRPHFTLNPTGCTEQQVTGQATSALGATAALASRFQVLGCDSLPYKPRLTLSLKGKTARAGHPALRATLQMKEGEANIERTVVTLPPSEFLAQSHIRTICTRVQFAADACPKGSVYGHVRAFTPLLSEPLEGPVYLRSNGGERELPDLVARLGGQIEIDLVGYIDSSKAGGLRTTFAQVPDAPVSKFVLQMPGGSRGLLENRTELCRGTHAASVKTDAHSGKVADFRAPLRVRCGGHKKR